MEAAEGGKGPGYAIAWSIVTIIFFVLITTAAILGYVPWLGAVIANAGIIGLLTYFMLTAKWSKA